MSKNLKEAFFYAGGQAEVARLMGVSRQVVTSWKRRGFPIARCIPLETVTRGIVHRKLTRPKDWRRIWPEMIGLKAVSTATQIRVSNNFHGKGDQPVGQRVMTTDPTG